jgi:hypothetical protein
MLGRADCQPRLSCAAYALPSELRSTRQSPLAIFFFRFTVGVWLFLIFVVAVAAYGATLAVNRIRGKGQVRSRFHAALPGVGVAVVVLVILRYV